MYHVREAWQPAGATTVEQDLGAHISSYKCKAERVTWKWHKAFTHKLMCLCIKVGWPIPLWTVPTGFQVDDGTLVIQTITTYKSSQIEWVLFLEEEVEDAHLIKEHIDQNREHIQTKFLNIEFDSFSTLTITTRVNTFNETELFRTSWIKMKLKESKCCQWWMMIFLVRRKERRVLSRQSPVVGINLLVK